MKNIKTKNKNTNKFGVFNGSVVNSETLANENEFKIENYKDDSLTISEIKNPITKDKKNEISVKKNKFMNKNLIYKITIYIIILLIILILIIGLIYYK